MKRRHFILRGLSDLSVDFDILGRPKSLGLGDQSNVTLEVDELDDEQAQRVRDEGNTVGPAMQMNLITPAAGEDIGSLQTNWGLDAIGLGDTTYTGKGSTVAVLDTGIDRGHPAFSHLQSEAIVEMDFTGTGNGDGNGHGTHCAGTIFGQPVNGQRIGVAPGIKKAYIAKVLDAQGSGTTEMLFDGFLWAVQEGVDVISMSVGFDFPGQVQKAVQQFNYEPAHAASQTLVEFVQNLKAFEALVQLVEAKRPREEGSIVVAAAGNESTLNYRIAASLPAATQNVISVGAAKKGLVEPGKDCGIAEFSNTLPEVVAPGVGVISAKPGGGVVSMDGTSMACPHVAGVAALWWEAVRKRPVPTKAEVVRERLLASCREDVFADKVVLNDRGRGMVTAP